MPSDTPKLTPAEMRALIERAPFPLSGQPIHLRGLESGEAYKLAAEAAARAMLIVVTEHPKLLDLPEGAGSFKRASHDAAWKAACKRWPGLDDWIGGLTGFMFGWANNAVRYAVGAEAVGNPAIVTIEGSRS